MGHSLPGWLGVLKKQGCLVGLANAELAAAMQLSAAAFAQALLGGSGRRRDKTSAAMACLAGGKAGASGADAHATAGGAVGMVSRQRQQHHSARTAVWWRVAHP
jgi:hypothetical protein